MHSLAKYGEEQAVIAPGAPSATLKVFEDSPGHYRAVLLIRTVKHGTFAIRILFDRVPDGVDGEAIAGALERIVAPQRVRTAKNLRLRRRELSTTARPHAVVADFGFSPPIPGVAEAAEEWKKKIARPVLDTVAAVLNHPLAAIAASSSVLIPGVGPVYLVSYALAQSAVDYAERKLR